MTTLLRSGRQILERAYVTLVGATRGQRLNNALLRMALHARGYGNAGSPEDSGESCFLQRLNRQPVDLCIDVGANRGDYSARLLQENSATVIAFEPQPTVYRQLATLATRYPGRMYAFNEGVADTEGELDLYWGHNSELATFSAETLAIGYVGQCNVNRSKIPVTSLDSFFGSRGSTFVDRAITLLKIDTEGFEYEVLAGAAHTLRLRPPQYIQVEFNNHQLFRGKTIYAMSKLLPGYRLHQMLPGRAGLYPVAAEDPLSNIFSYSNFIFERGR